MRHHRLLGWCLLGVLVGCGSIGTTTASEPDAASASADVPAEPPAFAPGGASEGVPPSLEQRSGERPR